MTAAARTMLADSQAIAASLVVSDIVKKKYRNEEPRPAHLKPPLAESPFGQFPSSYHMRDTWSGNLTCRYRDRTPDRVRRAAKDPVSYLNRNVPKRMTKSVSADVLRTTKSMADLMNTTAGEKKEGFAKKFEESEEKEIPVHLRSNFNINGSSIIHEAPPRPLTAAERRTVRKKEAHRTEKTQELRHVGRYMKKAGKFWIPTSKLTNEDGSASKRPLTAPPIRAVRAAKLRAPKVPRAGAYKKRTIEATVFRKYYSRGDLPVKIDHCAGGNKVLWSSDVRKLDYHVYLPIFVDGLREVDDPYRFLAIQGVIDMIQAAPEKLLPVVPQLILPINNALGTKEPDIICSVLKILQQMLLQNPHIGQAFVPYFRSILPVFNLFRSNEKNLGDMFDYSQRRRLDLGELIRETLEMFEMYGGPDAFINIKYMCPTYESCRQRE
ncbi:hypothetical protein TrCOL_g4630 [Triparma columacea]|nr:hypothetical protein TrCOL_g4630 [Triparma columacea]